MKKKKKKEEGKTQQQKLSTLNTRTHTERELSHSLKLYSDTLASTNKWKKISAMHKTQNFTESVCVYVCEERERGRGGGTIIWVSSWYQYTVYQLL